MKQKLILYLWVTAFLSVVYSCGSPDRPGADISSIEIPDLHFRRYEKSLFAIDPDSLKPGLEKIAAEYPIFLNADLNDTLNLIQLHDFVSNKLNIELYDSVESIYPDLSVYAEQFTRAFKYFRYHFPKREVPEIFTYVSGLVFDYPVQFFNGDMIIALDMYLGADYLEYRKLRLPLYRIQRMNSDYIVRDGIYELFYNHFLEKPGKNVLEKMINKGKHLYFLDALLPESADHIKIGYPIEKLQWCIENEHNIWAFMIENELLYSSSSQTLRNLFTDGPFTHSFSQESPARIGEWMGWQIVRSYMNSHPGLTIETLMMEEDAQKILEDSGYKPGR